MRSSETCAPLDFRAVMGQRHYCSSASFFLKWDCLLQLSYVYLSIIYWVCGAEHCRVGHRALDEEEPQQSTALKEHHVSGLDLHEIMVSEPDAGIGWDFGDFACEEDGYHWGQKEDRGTLICTIIVSSESCLSCLFLFVRCLRSSSHREVYFLTRWIWSGLLRALTNGI